MPYERWRRLTGVCPEAERIAHCVLEARERARCIEDVLEDRHVRARCCGCYSVCSTIVMSIIA